MQRSGSIALRAAGLSWDRLTALLPSAMEQLGLVVDSGAKAGHMHLHDYGERGCVVFMEESELSRRVARALATAAGVNVEVFEVSGTRTDKGCRFRADAHRATATGELKPFEGVELPLDDLKQEWGGGDLEARTARVLREFGALPTVQVQSKSVGYKKRSAGRPSTPRVATLLATLKKAKSFEGAPQPNGKVELRMEMAAGGRQVSYCTPDEFAELERLVGGKRG